MRKFSSVASCALLAAVAAVSSGATTAEQPASLIDRAQPRPRGAATRDLLADSRDEALTRDLSALIAQEVAARGLTDDLARLDAPRLDSGRMRSIAWWGAPGNVARLRLGDLLDQAARNSVQIGVFSELPAIRATSIDEAKGRYTPELFGEGRYNRRNEPTTSLAQTRGNDRLREKDTAFEFGVRARTRTGAEVTLSERLSNLDTNLIDYIPPQQARSRTVLGVVQPLLREGGTRYNDAVVKIARIETEVAESEFARQAESHLLEVIRSYWTLYLARAALAQQQHAAQAVDMLVGRIERRSGLDQLTLQVNRARAVQADRRASLVRSESAVRNAQTRLRALINLPGLGLDLGTAELPAADYRPIGFKSLATQALESRPEIKQGLLSYRAALLREGMAANEALPQLDLVLETSVNGRDGNFAFGDSFHDAADHGMSYVAGLRFGVPLGNDERKARRDRRRIESNQQALQLRSTVETTLLETQVAANEYDVAYAEMMRRAEAVQLASEDQRVLVERYNSGAGLGGNSPTDATVGALYLDRMLDSQTRVVSAERELAEAQATFQVASAAVSRARGTLLSDLGFAVVSERSPDGLPRYKLTPLATASK